MLESRRSFFAEFELARMEYNGVISQDDAAVIRARWKLAEWDTQPVIPRSDIVPWDGKPFRVQESAK